MHEDDHGGDDDSEFDDVGNLDFEVILINSCEFLRVRSYAEACEKELDLEFLIRNL